MYKHYLKINFLLILITKLKFIKMNLCFFIVFVHNLNNSSYFIIVII